MRATANTGISKKKITYPNGLGLSLSYDIVIAHDGEITVDTKEGAGTAFIINLPFAE